MKRVAFAALLASSVAYANSTEDDDGMGQRVQELLRTHQADVFGCVGDPPANGEALLHVVAGDGLPLKVEVLDAQADAHTAASCVASKARHWDLSSLHAHSGDQVVFPLRFRPAQPDQDSIHATLSVRKLAPNHGMTLSAGRAHAVYVLAGSVKGVGVGDIAYIVDEQTVDISAEKKGATVLIAEAPNARGGRQSLAVHAPKEYALPGGSVRLYTDGIAGAPFAFDELCVKAGTTIPSHVHDGSDELLYIEHGKTTTVLGDAQTKQKNASTDQLVIPRGTRHAVTAEQDMCAVQVYAPAGPEQRFKKQDKP